MDFELLTRIKKITIIALASDDELVDSLVLKGGNAIEMGYSETIGKVSRPSSDLDFSINHGDFQEPINLIKERIERTLTQTFLENGYVLLDFKFHVRPKKPHEETIDFWGGYNVDFKLIEQDKFEKLGRDVQKATRYALPIMDNRSPKFELEFSKYEYVDGKKEFELEGYKFKIYTPEMIVFEKLRALCQQLPAYGKIVPGFKARARARDFFDIHLLLDSFQIDPTTEENLQMIKNIFSAKNVPPYFIEQLRNNKEIHSENWVDVQNTISATEDINDFDYYFEFLLSKFENLKIP